MSDYAILVFSRTTDFRHDSILAGTETLRELGAEHGFGVDATEDPQRFTDAALAGYAAVVFLQTSGDVLDGAQRTAFERYLRAGGGFVGVHGAATAEPSSAFYGDLLGVRFAGHPEAQPARLVVPASATASEDPAADSVAGFAADGDWFDEWYEFHGDPRAVGSRILLEVDESSYHGGTMGADHPIAWCRPIDAGRSWFTALGHSVEHCDQPQFRAHLLGGVRYAAGPNLAASPRR